MGIQIDAMPHECGTKKGLIGDFCIGQKIYSVVRGCTWEVLGESPERMPDRRKSIRCVNEHGEVKDFRSSVLSKIRSERKKVVERTCKSHPYYPVYSSMKTRCYNKNSEPYRWYGARGIKVCDRWLESFWNFVEDMGDRPEGFTLERLDNNKCYEPENCAWVSMQENIKNRRPNSGWRKKWQELK